MSKKEMIKNGENVSLDDGNVVVLNDVSVAEKEEEKEETPVELENQPQELSKEEISPVEVRQELDPVEIPVPTPTAVESDIPQIPVAPIDISGFGMPSLDVAASNTDDPTIYPQVDSEPVEVAPVSFGNNVSFNNPQFDESQFGSPMFGESVGNLDSFTNDPTNAINDDSGVFKTKQDVDVSFEEFIKDVRKSYQEHIAGPTKTLVEFVNLFKNWGDEVTANGLNRKLFDEYDKLNELLQQKKSYNKQSDEPNFEYNNEPSSNYGDDQFGNGMFK